MKLPIRKYKQGELLGALLAGLASASLGERIETIQAARLTCPIGETPTLKLVRELARATDTPVEV